jgi:ABC-type branched-subunit amino acid transport system permease subunit
MTYLVSVLTLGAITVVLCLGLNVQFGWAGDLNLSYYAYVALGAYVCGVVELPKAGPASGASWILGLHQPFVVGALGAVVASAIVGAVVGWIALRRVRGDYFAIVTLSITLIFYTFSDQYVPLFNGPEGLYGVPRVFGGVLHLSYFGYGLLILGISVVVMVILISVFEVLYRSSYGRTLRAVRDDSVSASVFGISPFRRKLVAYVVGSAVGGLGGALLVQYVGAFSPAGWSPLETFLLFSGIIVGGVGSVWGVFFGASIVLIGVPQLVLFIPAPGGNQTFLPAIQNMIIGLIILGFLYLKPRGVFPEKNPVLTAEGRLGWRSKLVHFMADRLRVVNGDVGEGLA